MYISALTHLAAFIALNVGQVFDHNGILDQFLGACNLICSSCMLANIEIQPWLSFRTFGMCTCMYLYGMRGMYGMCALVCVCVCVHVCVHTCMYL